MTEITADVVELMRQAPLTARNYMKHGAEDIDAMFGDGYAEAPPELLAAYMQTAAIDLMTAMVAKEIGEAIEEIAEAIRGHRRG